MKGFRDKPQGSKNDVIRNLQVEVQNVQMALKMSQMLIKRLLENTDGMGKDIGGSMTQITELQYQFGALIKNLNVDPIQLAATANEQRLIDFNEGSEKADQTESLTTGDTVTEDSTVILTSTTNGGGGGADTGIFRSRIKLTDAGVPALTKGLMGQPVGTKVDVELGGKVHHVELLAIRNPTPINVTSPQVQPPQPEGTQQFEVAH